jgi:hypothetical protein
MEPEPKAIAGTLTIRTFHLQYVWHMTLVSGRTRELEKSEAGSGSERKRMK